MNIRFGPAVSSSSGSVGETLKYLQKTLKFSNEVVELSFTKIDEVVFSEEIAKLFNQFKYKSIHLPVVKMVNNNKVFLQYPDPCLNKYLDIIDQIIATCDPNVVLIHPDQVSDFTWATSKYQKLLAFENMDIKKSFGKTISDMEKVFTICPNAKWVFDLNHIYTNDQTMKSVDDFYDKFKERLTHFHISGYGGFHDALCLSKEDIIIDGLVSLDYPIVDEGNLLEKDVLEEEFNYITKRIPLTK